MKIQKSLKAPPRKSDGVELTKSDGLFGKKDGSTERSIISTSTYEVNSTGEHVVCSSIQLEPAQEHKQEQQQQKKTEKKKQQKKLQQQT